MDSANYDRQIRLTCPTCGGTQFEFDEATDADDQAVKCAQCNRETTRRALIDDNSENINAHISEIGDEIVKDIGKELSKSLGKALKWK
jgi:predicted  nucleic acid-binding Zn-ribbon protein